MSHTGRPPASGGQGYPDPQFPPPPPPPHTRMPFHPPEPHINRLPVPANYPPRFQCPQSIVPNCGPPVTPPSLMCPTSMSFPPPSLRPQDPRGPPQFRPQEPRVPPPFQPQDPRCPPPFQQQEPVGPPPIRPQEPRSSHPFQTQEPRGPPPFQTQDHRGLTSYRPPEPRGPPPRFQPQELRGPLPFQEPRGLPSFQTQEPKGPPRFQSPEPRGPSQQSIPLYCETSAHYNQLYNVPPPHSSPRPETPTQVYIPPFPPPSAGASASFVEPPSVTSEHCTTFQAPIVIPGSDTWLQGLPQSLPLAHQERKMDVVGTGSEPVDAYNRRTQGQLDVSDENSFSKYKDIDMRRNDDRIISRSTQDQKRNRDFDDHNRGWRRRSRSPIKRRRSRSPGDRSCGYKRQRSRDGSRSSDQHRSLKREKGNSSRSRDHKQSRMWSSNDGKTQSSERSRRSGDNKHSELQDTTKIDADSPPRDSKSPGTEALNTRTSVRQGSRSPDSRHAGSSRKRSWSRSPIGLRKRSHSRSPGSSQRRSRSHSPGNSWRRSQSRSPGSLRRRSHSHSRDSSRRRSRSHSHGSSWRKSRSCSPGSSRRRSRSCSPGTSKRRSRSRSPGSLRRRSRSCSRGNSKRRSRSRSPGNSRRSSLSRSPVSYGARSSLHSSSRSSYAVSSYKEKHIATERELLLEKWRMNYCATTAEMQKKLEELAKMKPEEIVEHEKKVWTRTAPADLYYIRDENNPKVMKATLKLIALCDTFSEELVQRAEKVRSARPSYEPPPRKHRMRLAKHKSEICSSSDSSSEESSTDEEDCTMEELERKRLHPYRLHPEMWYNDSGEMNDGPLCRCSAKARRYGIRHGIYAGESHLVKCDLNTNNADKLYHYRITISPPTNFLTKTPTIIKHDEHEFIFEGFSMFSHFPLDKLPTCKVIRFNIEYTILYIDEKLPENFTIRELDLFHDYLFSEVLELVDLDFKAHGDSTGCSQFHFMPRFVRDLADNGKEILSMNEVLIYLVANSKALIEEPQLSDLLNMPQFKWQNFADEVKGMVVTYPGMKPCSVRVDQLDRDQQKRDELTYPEIVHFGIRPPQLSYAGNPEYQKAWREYVKFRHLLANMPKPSFEDKRKLEAKENKLQEMRTQSKMKRDVTVAVSAKGFHRTGIMCDIIQHAMLIPVLVCHLRFHRSCDVLERVIDYKFKNRFLLQLALTHPSYRENFGTNPDHARNSLTNCGIRQPEYGDRRIHYMNTRKRGINTLINIMSRFGKKTETESNITHNERLEFLGDAVVEFLTSIHLFHMFPDLEEGGLATYRAAIVQNQHLAVLAKILNLEEYMLYAHGSDLCHDLELRHAMANCFEALMGALFLDGGIEVADKVFAETLFKQDPDLLDVWVNYPPHPLQEQEPLGDRKWIPSFELLQNLTKFEESIGVEFKHIRLLARAFTDRSIGYTNLTLGSNQRLEFLGDTVLQLIASEYLYKFFPEHHEGHLSLLRSSLVNNRTQAVVCDDLGMISYALYSNPKVELKTKDRADLLEAFLGALYVDKGLDYCQVFCHVCFFPRLQDFIMNQDWNDPKSKLQQCCLTLRTMEGGEPDIPVYKVIECKGPTNTRVYTVAVYFRGDRLAKASGHSIQQAEMNAAKEALEMSQGLFPQLDHQKRVIAKSLWRQRWPSHTVSRTRSALSSDRDRRPSSKERSKSSSSRQERKSSRERKGHKNKQAILDSKPGLSSFVMKHIAEVSGSRG
ncbi:ribonuclease 3 isoform X4 [Periplaneta americana]|uniref:ribonuclease 3 isoform X4 n=1 Tax=Periplaneta americana TaxID=6978 RepID=UPI0037E9469A